MTAPLAFRATYSDWKLVKTRGVVQIVMEVPIADYQSALDVLGGMPDPARENWFAVAPLKMPPAEKETKEPDVVSPTPRRLDKPAGAKPDWQDRQPSQQAFLVGRSPVFWAFLTEQKGYKVASEEDAKEAVYELCEIQSRRDLDVPENERQHTLWNLLYSAYRAWELVGA